MPTILALETSSETASVALLRQGHLFSRESAGVQTHSQSVLPMVQQVLSEAGIVLGDCDAIAFGAGPGSFTGVRTACGVAQGLGFGAQLPVVPIVTLLAMAEACRRRDGVHDVLAVLDARMGEVYWAQYRHGEAWETVVPPTLSKPEEVAPVGQPSVCGSGLAVYASLWADKEWMGDIQHEQGPHAAAVACLGRVAFLQGESLPAREAAPLYLRNKVALTSAERRAAAGA